MAIEFSRYERREADLLKSLNEAEIEKEEETSTLFRAASLTTTLMDLYMKSVCTGFLQSAVQDTILKLLDAKQSCEVNYFYRSPKISFTVLPGNFNIKSKTNALECNF